jgi:hypothetical protein
VDFRHRIVAVVTHRQERADVAGGRRFEAGLLFLQHPAQHVRLRHLEPQLPRHHPDMGGRALERGAGDANI